MHLHRRQFLGFAAGATSLPSIAQSAFAQSWPARPVRIIVGYPAGIAPDILARLVGEGLSSRLKQQFIVENRPGAGTSIAAEYVVNAPPDGYTLLLDAAANTINTSLYPNLNFNFTRDIVEVAYLGGVVFLLTVNPSVPAKTVPELIAYAKANPGKLNFASRGIGSLTHVFGELFNMMAGVNMVHVPYRGDYMADVLSGRVQVAFFAVADTEGYLANGRIRALGVTSKNRFVKLPDVPAVDEFLPGYEASGWLGLGAPKGSPAAIIETLNNAANTVLADSALKARLIGMGIEPNPMSANDFGAFVAAETEKWAKVVKFANIKPE
ncbi:MAG TPA: tripartite tricarboxylate transporter substrate binding protein [Xanthobacteraceae bacterium]|nr:tripartite tricarboxylate transporter substrate binding protein [Xanthobacteraceae bacterium]